MSRIDAPPLLARILARVLIPLPFRNEMEGDLLEGFSERTVEAGRRQAGRWYWRQVLSLRPFELRKMARRISSSRGLERVEDGLMEGWTMDVRNGWRYYRRRAGASLTVVLTIALAVAATTTVFSIVNGVLLQPLAYPQSEQLVRIYQTNPEWLDSPNDVMREMAARLPISMPIFFDWQSQSREWEAMGLFATQSFLYRGSDGAEYLTGASASSGVFRALGVHPAQGRPITEDDDRIGAEPVAVLSHRTWVNRFGSDPETIGKTLTLGSTTFSIVGIMPQGFGFPSSEEEFWVTLPAGSRREDRQSMWLGAIGRVRDGSSLEAATAEIESVQARLAETYPEEQGSFGVSVVPMLESVVGDIGTTLWFLLGSVGLALLVACVNIANVLTVMGLDRRGEFALKAAMGAGRARLVRGQLVEASLLTGVGGILGVLISALALPSLLALLPPEIPRQDAVGMDLGVLGFGFGVTLITALVVALYPAIQTGLARPAEMLKGCGRAVAGRRRSGRVRAFFVVSEVAIAVVLLVGAGLLGNSFARLWTVERGFNTEGLVAMSIVPDRVRFPEQEDRDRFLREFRAELDALPGMVVTATNQIPLNQSTAISDFELEDARGSDEGLPFLVSVTLDNYFQVMEIPLIEGREFDAGDIRGAPQVAIVNQTLADGFWPGRSALGQRLRESNDEEWVTIVGIVRDVRHQGLDKEPEPKVYFPAGQSDVFPQEWIARAGGTLSGAQTLLRGGLRSYSPETAVLDMEILEHAISRSVAVPRFRTLFVCCLAGLAALLALVGVYGVVSFTVAQRAREIGIRVALGSGTGQVVRESLVSGFRLAVVGLLVGLLLAALSSSVLAEFLFRIQPNDPVTFLVTALLVALVGLLSAYLPARRAAGVDPVTVLKAE